MRSKLIPSTSNMVVRELQLTLAPSSTNELEKWYDDQLSKFKALYIVLGVRYTIIFLLSLLVIRHMHHIRAVAFRGNTSAARKIILPAYIPLLQLLMALSCIYALYFWIVRFATMISDFPSNVETEVYSAGRLLFILITPAFMLQKSVTGPALRRAAFFTLVMSTYCIPVVWLSTAYCPKNAAYWISQFARMAQSICFIWVFIFPPARASPRTIREYCAFVLVDYILTFVSNDLFHRGIVNEGYTLTFINLLWGSFCPLVIWRVLRADTEHWRGLGRRACILQSIFRQKNRMDERISSRGLHVLIEMHRKYIIDFAYLELRTKIGDGSSAVVFNGMLRSKTAVAIKVYTPTELTDEVVAEFSHEAALCGALHHPNIVRFYGMCVCPPTICLIFELCLGSLRDITVALSHRPHHTARRQFVIDLNYMIDATRAVAYLHSFSPAFVHRDIKPSNFLIDHRNVVKLTDFGESRSLPHARAAAVENSKQRGQERKLSPCSSPPDSQVTVDIEEQTTPRSAMTVRGTAEYMAPEMIQGKAGQALYGEAADIFSLTMTFWDVMHPLEDKYPETNNNHLKVFEAVMGGQRPPLAENFHPELRDLFTSGWADRPELRPSTLYVLNTLERIHQEVSCELMMEMAYAMHHKTASTKDGCSLDDSYSGHALVQAMVDFGFVDSVPEAVRVGNGLMSSQLLHHSRHVHTFEDTDKLFQFDDTWLQLLKQTDQWLALPPILERSGVDATSELPSLVAPTSALEAADLVHPLPVWRKFTSSVSSVGPGRISTQSAAQTSESMIVDTSSREKTVCQCRKLGAGMVIVPKGQQRRFRLGKKGLTSVSSWDRIDVDTAAAFDRVRGFGTTQGSDTPRSTGMYAGGGDVGTSLTAKLLMNEYNYQGVESYTMGVLDSPRLSLPLSERINRESDGINDTNNALDDGGKRSNHHGRA